MVVFLQFFLCYFKQLQNKNKLNLKTKYGKFFNILRNLYKILKFFEKYTIFRLNIEKLFKYREIFKNFINILRKTKIFVQILNFL